MSTARDMAARVRAGRLDPRDPAAEALAAIEALAALRAVITACPGRRASPEGRLAGVPVLVKDLIDVAGVRSTYGSSIYSEHVASRTAGAVAALEREGAVVVGKTNCDEFAWGISGQNEHYGDVVNPRLPGRIAGGSSSGNAAALAAKVSPIALGTDTGGSVRAPAACCGVVGLKPALGSIPTDGVFPLCPSFDTVGPMAGSVEDCVLAHEVLTGRAPPAPSVRGLVAGVLTRRPAVGPSAVPEPRDERALVFAERLEALGARVVEVELPAPGGDTWPVFYGEAAISHRGTFPARRDEYGRGIRVKLDDAQRVGRAELASARAALAAWRERARSEPAVDLFVSPALGLEEIPAADVDELEIRVPFSAYARVFSNLGWPAIAIGEVQLAAREERTLLAAALAWEDAYGPPS